MSFLESLLPVFYRSAEQPENWSYALNQIKQEMQVSSVVIQKMKRSDHRLKQEWVVRDSVSTEQAEAHDCLVNNDDNPRLNLKNLPKPVSEMMVYRGEDNLSCSNNSTEFKALQQRQQMLGLGQPIILGLKYSDNSSLCMLMHRYADDAREFTEDHVTFLQTLSPHLKQTVSLAEKLGLFQEQTETFNHCLNQFNSGLLILNHRGELSWANNCARHILKRSQHLSLSGSKLRCTTVHDQQQLTELVASAFQTNQPGQRFVGSLGATRTNPLQVLAVSVQPTSAKLSEKSDKPSYVALYLSELETHTHIPATEIMALFGLTPAEARLAIALCDGASLNDYALNQGITVGTARIQLKSVFSKLGINRQPELVRLIGSSIAAKTLHQIN